MTAEVSGIEPGQRHLNGPQTTGRDYRNLSEPVFSMRRTNNVAIAVRDGTIAARRSFPAGRRRAVPGALSFSPYPRQIQDVGAPLGFIEAGASDFFVPRGYVHLIANARGTGGSGGTWTLLDGQERDDLYDLVEWVAAQPWCDGNVGMLGVSYFAMAQLAAAVDKPPHLKAIAPLLTTDDVYDAVWHHGLLNAGFISAWLPAVGVLSQRPDKFWRGWRIDIVRDILAIPAIHARMQHINGEAIVTLLKDVIHAHYPEVPFGELWQAVAVEHPTRDAFWDARDMRPASPSVDIPVYLGADWDNVPLHLPSTFTAWEALRRNPNVRMAMLPPGGFSWPWESPPLRGARLVRPLAEGPRHRRHGGAADPLSGSRRRRLADVRRVAAAGSGAHALRAPRRRRARAGGRRARLPRVPLPPRRFGRAQATPTRRSCPPR